MLVFLVVPIGYRIDRRHSRFRKFSSTVFIDVVRVGYCVNGLFYPTRVPMRVSVNKFNLALKRFMPGFINVFRNG